MIEIVNLSKKFENSGHEFYALSNINLTIDTGDIFGIIGMSGAGKSTLVRCINMLERPTDGKVIIDGVDLTTLNEKELREKRREITMIFQGFNLLMQKNCLDNVCFPLELCNTNKDEAKKRALELLDIVGLKDKAKAYPAQLSGGQQQRVAIARALATKPKVLLCDEATSALDPSTTQSILKLLKEINEKLHITIVIITHQMSVVESICKHVAILENGKIVETGDVEDVFVHPKSKEAKMFLFADTNTIVNNEQNAHNNQLNKNDHFIRIVYAGEIATKTPILARLALEEKIEASIASATTRVINGKTFGNMILYINGDDDTVLRAKKFIEKTKDIIVEEVKNYV